MSKQNVSIILLIFLGVSLFLFQNCARYEPSLYAATEDPSQDQTFRVTNNLISRLFDDQSDDLNRYMDIKSNPSSPNACDEFTDVGEDLEVITSCRSKILFQEGGSSCLYPSKQTVSLNSPLYGCISGLEGPLVICVSRSQTECDFNNNPGSFQPLDSEYWERVSRTTTRGVFLPREHLFIESGDYYVVVVDSRNAEQSLQTFISVH